MPFNRVAFILITFLTFACQTTMPAKKMATTAPILAWDEILTMLQTGKIDIQNLNEADAKELDRNLMAMVKAHDWSRLTFIVERLHRSPSEPAQLLALHIRAELAFEQRSYAEVEKNCLEILKLSPENTPAKLALGLTYLYTSQFAKAIPYLNDTKPDPKALAGLISAHRQLGDNDRVDALCEKYQSEEAELWEISYNCSLFEAQNMQSPEKALQILQASLVKQTPDSEASRQLRSIITQIEVARAKPVLGQETM